MNRRSEPRFRAGDRITVKMLDVARAEPFKAVCVDCSASGLSLEIPISMPSGTRVRLSWADRSLIAEVRYCAQTAKRSYRAGVKI